MIIRCKPVDLALTQAIFTHPDIIPCDSPTTPCDSPTTPCDSPTNPCDSPSTLVTHPPPLVTHPPPLVTHPPPLKTHPPLHMAQFTREPGRFNFWSPRTQMGKLRIWKNVIILSLGFLFLFTSFQSISNLQSTMNSDEGLGTSSLAMVYGKFLSTSRVGVGCRMSDVRLSPFLLFFYDGITFERFELEG